MKKFLSVVLMICMLTLVGCGQGHETTDVDNNDKEKVIIGLDDTFAPLGFRNKDNELVGFDVDLAKKAGELMGVEVEFQPVEWAMKETELATKKIDMIWNGYSITPEREEKVLFSQPYLENRQIIVTMNNPDNKIESKADLAGKTVAVQAESSALEAVQKDKAFMDSIKGKKPVEYATNEDAFHDMEAGRSDAVVVDEVLARYYIKNNGQDKYRILEDNFGEEKFAVGLRKDEQELCDRLNKAFDEMKESGFYEEEYKKWFSEE